MFTSNYASLHKISGDLYPVAISQGVPKWYRGRVDKRLAPTWAMLRMNREDYDRAFALHLERLDAEQIYRELGENAVLICYEKHNDWCHRRMVAEWFEYYLGIEVPELGYDRSETLPYRECGVIKPKKKNEPEQGVLF